MFEYVMQTFEVQNELRFMTEGLISSPL